MRNGFALIMVFLVLASMVIVPMPSGALDHGMDQDLGDVVASFWGENAGDGAGCSVACAGDVNGDGVLELIGVNENKIVVLSPDGENIWERSYRTDSNRYFSVTALDDVFGTESPEILANAFFDGHPQFLIIDGSNGAVIRNFPAEVGVTDKIHDNLVYDIEIDDEGNLWFATSHDVCKFDGVSWEHVQSSPDEQPVEVFSLASDESHNIWAGTSSGLYRFESRWTLYPTIPNNADPIDFQIDDEGDVWLATRGAGIFRCERNKLVPYLLDWEAHQVRSMMIDRKRDCIWCSSWTLGVDRGLFKIELKKGANGKTKAEKIKDDRLFNNAITAMAFNHDGSLWFGGENGLNLYNPDTGECLSWTHKRYPDFLPDPDDRTDKITALYLDHDGKLQKMAYFLLIGKQNHASVIISFDSKYLTLLETKAVILCSSTSTVHRR